MTVAVNKVFNYARMTTATAGTGTMTLGSAVAPYLTFAQAGVVDGDIVYYSIVDGTANVECGIGTYTAAGTTLSRTTVLRSSGAANTGKITLSGSAEVHIEFLANSTSGFLAGPARGPTTQTFTSGTAATYTTPANCTSIKVLLVGAGGGGAATGTGATVGSNGTATTFNAGAITAPAGSTAGVNSQVGAAGGVAGAGGDFTVPGGAGDNANGAIATGNAGMGGGGYFGGGGKASRPNSGDPGAGATNSGAGGGGGQSGTGIGAGGGGGAGTFTSVLINSPAATYTYTVGASGSGGVAGTNGSVGGAGAAGIIIVEEYYT